MFFFSSQCLSRVQFAVCLYHIGLRVIETAERCYYRGTLCVLARCMRLYCAMHPMSTAGWRALFAMAVFFLIHIANNTYTGLWWIDGVYV